MAFEKKNYQRPIERLDEIFSEEDNKIFSRIMEGTNRLLISFNKRRMCNKMIDLIDKSEYIKFSDTRNKLTNIVKPVFNVRVDLTRKCLEKYPNDFIEEYINKKLNSRNLDEDKKKIISEYKIMIIKEEVIEPFSLSLSDEIKKLEKTDKEFKKIKEEIKEKLDEKDEEKVNRYIIPSIFTILVEKVEQNVVKIEYIM